MLYFEEPIDVWFYSSYAPEYDVCVRMTYHFLVNVNELNLLIGWCKNHVADYRWSYDTNVIRTRFKTPLPGFGWDHVNLQDVRFQTVFSLANLDDALKMKLSLELDSLNKV